MKTKKNFWWIPVVVLLILALVGLGLWAGLSKPKQVINLTSYVPITTTETTIITPTPIVITTTLNAITTTLPITTTVTKTAVPTTITTEIINPVEIVDVPEMTTQVITTTLPAISTTLTDTVTTTLSPLTTTKTVTLPCTPTTTNYRGGCDGK